MPATLKAAFAYVGIVFGVGFVLGTIRVLAVAPYLGSTLAVVVELPLMLTVSWYACRWVIGRFSVGDRWRHRLALGGMAFALLMTAELGVSTIGFGRSVAEHLATYRTAPGALGLLAQIGFALFPMVQGRPGEFRRPAPATLATRPASHL